MKRIQTTIKKTNWNNNDGFTLVEVIVSTVAFTVIMLGLTTVLITAANLQRATAESATRRSDVQMIREFLSEIVKEGEIQVADGGKTLQYKQPAETDYKTLIYTDSIEAAIGTKDATGFVFSGGSPGKTVNLHFESDGKDYDILVQCPLN